MSDKRPMVILDVFINFLDICMNKLLSIWLIQGLLEVHDVAHHLGMKCDGMAHSFLKFQVLVME